MEYTNKDRSILRTFLKYVSSNIVGMIGLSCFILADTFFIAKGTGEAGLTALNLAIPAYSFMNGIALMISMGGATRYSLTRESDAHRQHTVIFTRTLYCSLLFGAFFFCIGLFFSERLALLLGADDTTFQLATDYIRVTLMFAPAFYLNNLFLCFVRNDNAPRLAMSAMLTGSISNIILDYIFVFPLDLGIGGAAFATGLAPLISMGVLSAHKFQKRNQFHLKPVLPSLRTLIDVTGLGASSLITEVSNGLVMIVFNTLLLRISGNTAVAAYGVVANISLVLIAIFTGISQGTQPIISGCYGKQEKQNVRTVYRYAIVSAVLFALATYILLFVFAEPISELFNRDQNPMLTELAVTGLRIYFAGFLFTGINVVSAAFLSSIDRPVQGFLISLSRGLLLIVPLALVLSYLLGMTGIWLTVPVAELITVMGTIIFIHYIFRKFL